MRVRFNGLTERRKKGCPVCGKGRYDSTFVTSKRYYLPSGAYMYFRVHQDAEVADEDGEFLLSEEYIAPDGSRKKVFTKL